MQQIEVSQCNNTSNCNPWPVSIASYSTFFTRRKIFGKKATAEYIYT